MTRLGADQNSSGDVRAIPFPEMFRPIVLGASESDLLEAYLERLLENTGGNQSAAARVAFSGSLRSSTHPSTVSP